MRLCLWPFTMAVKVAASQACGSISLSLHVSMSEAIAAQFSAPA